MWFEWCGIVCGVNVSERERASEREWLRTFIVVDQLYIGDSLPIVDVVIILSTAFPKCNCIH